MPEKTGGILAALGLASSSDETVIRDTSRQWCGALGIDMRLSAHGVPDSDLQTMATEAHAIRRLLDNNPRDLSADQILTLYRAAY